MGSGCQRKERRVGLGFQRNNERRGAGLFLAWKGEEGEREGRKKIKGRGSALRFVLTY